jgi:integrase/recombinase XerD
MTAIHWERYPQVAALSSACTWLTIQHDLGLAQTTLEAYGRALQDYLSCCAEHHIDPETATRAHVAVYVGDLLKRPHRQGQTVIQFTSGSGLANATIQQRLVAVRLFYDHLVEEGRRQTNPVGRGRYTVGKGFGGLRARGLVPRLSKLPWIPTDDQWQAILAVARDEPIRNRVMLALAYDAGLRRQELCALRSDALDPAHRLLCIRAETTKGQCERVVPYSAATGVLLQAYLGHRRTLSAARGPLFLSEHRFSRDR